MDTEKKFNCKKFVEKMLGVNSSRCLRNISKMEFMINISKIYQDAYILLESVNFYREMGPISDDNILHVVIHMFSNKQDVAHYISDILKSIEDNPEMDQDGFRPLSEIGIRRPYKDEYSGYLKFTRYFHMEDMGEEWVKIPENISAKEFID